MTGLLYDVWDLSSQLLPHNFVYWFSAADLPTEEGAVSVLTYNVNMGLATKGKRDESSLAVVDAIRKSEADIVLLQETHTGWQKLLGEELQTQFPFQAFHFDASGGSAILSRWRVKSWEAFRLADSVNGSHFDPMVGVIDVPGGEWTVANVHLRPPLEVRGQTGIGTARRTGPIRLAEMQELFRRCEASRLSPLVVAGDFNEQDWGEALDWLAQERGMRDALQEHVSRWKETHRWPFGPGTMLKKRLDHVVYDPGQLRCLGCGVITGYEDGASDHQPVLARFVRDASGA